jgi:hypothetical protein
MKPQRPRVPHPAKAGMLLAAALLAGCSADHDELRQWTEQQRRDIKPSITPLQPPKKFDPEPYTQSQAVDPFNSQKLSAALKAVLNRDDVRAQLEKGGVEPAFSTPQQFDAMVRAEHTRWNRLLADLIK